MKKLTKYAIWLILGFIFVSVMSYLFVRQMFYPFNEEDYSINTTYPEVKIEEAKHSNYNGYVKGTIKNNTDNDMPNLYIRIVFKNKNGVDKCTESYYIENLKADSTQDFKVTYDAQNVTKFDLSIADSDGRNYDIEFQNLKELTNTILDETSALTEKTTANAVNTLQEFN